jgi:hypothetical protein
VEPRENMRSCRWKDGSMHTNGRTRPSPEWVAALAVVLGIGTGCQKLDVCGKPYSEVRVNQRGDDNEFFDHARAATILESGKILTAFVSASTSHSEVRIALLGARGEAKSACGESANTVNERVLSDPGKLAYNATVAPARGKSPRATIVQAVAAAAWVEGGLNDHQVQVRLLDDAGCDVATSSLSGLAQQLGPTDTPHLFFSPTQARSLVVFAAARGMYAAWIDVLSTPAPIELAPSTHIQTLAAAMDEQGRLLVVWADSPSIDDVLGRRFEVRGLLLDEHLRRRPSVLGHDGPEPFVLPFPQQERSEDPAPALAAAYGGGRFAVALQAPPTRANPNRISVLEITAESGTLLQGPVYLPEADQTGAQLRPALAYLSAGPLLASWTSSAHGGTMGGLFDARGRFTFNAVSCEETPFPIGARSSTPAPGWPALLAVGTDQWIFHAGDSPSDPRGSAAVATAWPIEWIWPGLSYGQ